MSVAPPVTPAEARAFLRRWSTPAVTEVIYVGEGQWSRCYGFVQGGRDLVVRFGRHVEDFERDRVAARWATVDLPVPEVLDLVEESDWWAAISTRVRGEPLESLSTEGWRTVLPSLLASLDAMRAVDLSASQGFGPWDADGCGRHKSWREALLAVGHEGPDDRTPGWRGTVAAEPALEAVFVAGLARLTVLADACPQGHHLIHDDLLNRNVLVTDGRVTGVFDWGCSMYGDHLYDLAHLLFWAPWYPALEALDLRSKTFEHLDLIGLAVPDADHRLTACQLRLGLGALAYSAHIGDPSVTWIVERIDQLLES